MNSNDTKPRNPIVLFDGICGLCETSVRFIIDHDPSHRFRFAPLQSEIGRELLEKYQVNFGELSTIVLIDEEGAHVRSGAVIRICLILGNGFTPLGEFLAMIPVPLADGIYTWIARNRYRWFGKREVCRLPTPGVARRFLT